MKNKKLKLRGFTLVELLVSIGLFSSIAIIIISMLFTAFRASSKSEVIISVKQNGNIAMSQMINSIRFAKSLDDPTTCTTTTEQDSISITGLDGGHTVYSCPNDTVSTISSNSAALVNQSLVFVAACSFICNQSSEVDPPTITIQFTLNAANSTDLPETSSSIDFKSSVTMRNYSR